MNKKNFYENRKVLITGATGFKGAWLSKWLLMLGAKVYGLGFAPNNNKRLFNQLNLKKRVNLKNIDIRNYNLLCSYLKKIKPVVVFHLAAQPIISRSYELPKYTYEVNSLGTLNLINAIKETSTVRSAIFVTSDKCYESNNSTVGFVEHDKLGGVDPYSGSKACAEIIVKTYINSFLKEKKIGIATARAGNVIGGGDWSKDRLIPDAIKFLNEKKKITIRNPNFNRPWQHVLEPLSGYLNLAEKLFKDPKKYSGAWNFGTEKNTVTSVEQIIKKIIYFWGSGTYGKLKKYKFYEQENLQLNILKSKKILKWKPKLSINECIELTVEWYKWVLFKKGSAENITYNQIQNFIEKK